MNSITANMKFLNSLYTIASECSLDSGYEYTIRLNSGHFIYAAHFPGEPITPGVCILQISAELLSRLVGGRLEVVCIKNVKFLQILTPEGDREVTVRISNPIYEDDTVKSQISVITAENTISKISMICRIVG